MNYLGNNSLFKMRNVIITSRAGANGVSYSFVLSLWVLTMLAETMCSRGTTWSSLREFKQESQVPFFFYFFGKEYTKAAASSE